MIPPGDAYGMVIATTLEGETGSIDQVRITYESGGRTYESVGIVTISAAEAECG